MDNTKKPTAVLGASPNAERYSNKAIRLLKQHGHPVIPVHKVHKEIEGETVAPSLSAVTEPIHTVTLYVGKDGSDQLAEEIVRANPQRVVINPGAGSEKLEQSLRAAGIPFEHACTLVLLRTGQY